MRDQSPLPSPVLTVDPLMVATNFFSIECLELTFTLLRKDHPSLALVIQNALTEARRKSLTGPYGQLIELHETAPRVKDIISALAAITETAANSQHRDKKHIVVIHQALLDWLLYAQSFLTETAPPKHRV